MTHSTFCIGYNFIILFWSSTEERAL